MEKIVKESQQVRHANATWLGEWVSYMIDGKESKDRWLKLQKKVDGQFVSIENLDDVTTRIQREVEEHLCELREEELREEYGVLAPDADKLSIAEKILTDTWNGKWMGQTLSYYFYMENLARLLNITFMEASTIVDSLYRKKVAGLNGLIIVPWQEERDANALLEKRTGHKQLKLADFDGIWHCDYCMQHGEEGGLRPEETACVRIGDE